METLVQVAQHYTPKIEKAFIALAKGKDDPSEGSFETVFAPNEINHKGRLSSAALTPSLRLQISVEVNPQLATCVVLFGAPYQGPKKRSIFQLPDKIDRKRSHSIKVHWQNRNIDYVEFDKARLVVTE